MQKCLQLSRCAILIVPTCACGVLSRGERRGRRPQPRWQLRRRRRRPMPPARRRRSGGSAPPPRHQTAATARTAMHGSSGAAPVGAATATVTRCVASSWALLFTVHPPQCDLYRSLTRFSVAQVHPRPRPYLLEAALPPPCWHCNMSSPSAGGGRWVRGAVWSGEEEPAVYFRRPPGQAEPGGPAERAGRRGVLPQPHRR